MPLVAEILHNVCDIEVVPWMWLDDFLRGDHRGEHPHAARSGAYILAVNRRLSSSVDLADPNIICIGESHGPGVNLYVRLHAFAVSAKVKGARGVFRHSGGERFAARAAGLPGRVCVAVVPYVGRPRQHPDWRGITPMLVEKLLLAAFLQHHHRQPVLNEDGRHVTHEWIPMITDHVLQRWSRTGFTESNSQPAVEWLRHACSRAKRIETPWKESPDDDWKGIDANVHRRGWSVYVGQYGGRGTPVLEAWLKNEEKPRLREPLSDESSTRQLASELNYRLRNGWNDERY